MGKKIGRNDPCPCGSGKNINCVASIRCIFYVNNLLNNLV